MKETGAGRAQVIEQWWNNGVDSLGNEAEEIEIEESTPKRVDRKETPKREERNERKKEKELSQKTLDISK